MSLFAFLLVLSSTAPHAGWNLLGHSRRANQTFFLQLLLVIAVVGLAPSLVAQLVGHALPAGVWALAAGSSLFLALYYLGLTMGYRFGEFSVVYPVARSLPVLILSVIDALRGLPPSAQGLTGIALVVLGCLLAPQRSLAALSSGHYWNLTMVWIVLISIGMTGYSAIDKFAAEHLPDKGAAVAMHYGAIQFSLAAPVLWIYLRVLRQCAGVREMRSAGWRWPAVAAAMTFVAYALVLWAYQFATHTSYIVAVRQFSVVLGVLGARAMFHHERIGWTRGIAVTMLTAGVVIISLARS